MNIIAIANLKGGTAKTTSAVTIATGLARRAHNILLIDLDAQGHCATCLGLEKKPAFYDFIVSDIFNPVQVESNLSVLVGNYQTEQVQRHLTTTAFSETLLKRRFATLDYDYIILDFPPSINILTVAGLVASNFVLAPTKLDPLSVEGLGMLLRNIQEIDGQGFGFEGWACLPTFYEKTTAESANSLSELVKAFPKNVWPPIATSTKVRTAPAYGQSLWDYDPKNRALLGLNGIGGYVDTVTRLEAI